MPYLYAMNASCEVVERYGSVAQADTDEARDRREVDGHRLVVSDDDLRIADPVDADRAGFVHT